MTAMTTIAVGHRLLGGGRVRLIMPQDATISESDARRLAWGLLADLAPDEAQPEVVVTTKSESQRIAVLKLLDRRPLTAAQLAASMNWPLRTAQRRLSELVDDGRAGSTVQRGAGSPCLYQKFSSGDRHG